MCDATNAESTCRGMKRKIEGKQNRTGQITKREHITEEGLSPVAGANRVLYTRRCIHGVAEVDGESVDSTRQPMMRDDFQTFLTDVVAVAVGIPEVLHLLVGFRSGVL